MNGIMKENQLFIDEKFDFNKPLIHRIDCLIDNCIRDCQNIIFHRLEYKCVYDEKLKNNRNNETFNLTSSDKIMGSYERIEKLKNARQKRFYM